MICLDTNYLIRALVPNTAQAVQVSQWLKQRTTLTMSTIAWCEFCCGPLAPKDHQMAKLILTGGLLPFSPEQAMESARLFNAAGRKRGIRVDAMIAATAILAQMPLATENRDDFKAFLPLGLRLLPSSAATSE